MALSCPVIQACRCASVKVPTLGDVSPVPGCVAGCGRRAGSSATTKTNSTWTPPTRNSAARLCSPTWKGFAGSSDIIIRYPKVSWLALFRSVAHFGVLVLTPGSSTWCSKSCAVFPLPQTMALQVTGWENKGHRVKEFARDRVVSLLSGLSCCSMQCVVIAVICIRFKSVDN